MLVMFKYFAHESAQHIHTGGSSSPAIYVGLITMVVLAIIIIAVLLLSQKTEKNRNQQKSHER